MQKGVCPWEYMYGGGVGRGAGEDWAAVTFHFGLSEGLP